MTRAEIERFLKATAEDERSGKITPEIAQSFRDTAEIALRKLADEEGQPPTTIQ
jgi:hypothetical protein